MKNTGSMLRGAFVLLVFALHSETADATATWDVCGENVDLSEALLTLEKGKDPLVDCIKGALNPKEHDSNDSAVTNVKPGTGQVAVMLGHGDKGKICTAESCKAPDTVLSAATTKGWGVGSKSLTGVSMVILAACNVGAGNAAPKLLKQMSDALDVPVVAPSGVILCEGDDVSVQKESQWQCAQPGRALLKAVPRPPYKVDRVALTTFPFRTAEGRVVRVPPESVKMVWMEVADETGTFHCLSRSDSARGKMLSRIDLANRRPGTVVGATATARFKIAVKDQRLEGTRTFEVYNNASAADVSEPGFHLLLDSRLSNTLDKVHVPMDAKACEPAPNR